MKRTPILVTLLVAAILTSAGDQTPNSKGILLELPGLTEAIERTS